MGQKPPDAQLSAGRTQKGRRLALHGNFTVSKDKRVTKLAGDDTFIDPVIPYVVFYEVYLEVREGFSRCCLYYLVMREVCLAPG